MPKRSRASLNGGTLKSGRPAGVFGKTPSSDALVRATLVKRENPVPPAPRRPSLKQEVPGPHPAMRSTPKGTSSRLPWNEGVGMSASQIVDLLTERSVSDTFGGKREQKAPALDAVTLLNLSSNGFSHQDTEFDRSGKGPDPSLRWSNFIDPDGNQLSVVHGRANNWTLSSKHGKPLHGGKDLQSLTRYLLGDRQTYKLK